MATVGVKGLMTAGICCTISPPLSEGMTSYRIDRIGTHRHTQTRIGTDFDHIDTTKQGQGYESIVSRYGYWAKGN